MFIACAQLMFAFQPAKKMKVLVAREFTPVTPVAGISQPSTEFAPAQTLATLQVNATKHAKSKVVSVHSANPARKKNRSQSRIARSEPVRMKNSKKNKTGMLLRKIQHSDRLQSMNRTSKRLVQRTASQIPAKTVKNVSRTLAFSRPTSYSALGHAATRAATDSQRESTQRRQAIRDTHSDITVHSAGVFAED